jgi:spermidine synthase
MRNLTRKKKGWEGGEVLLLNPEHCYNSHCRICLLRETGLTNFPLHFALLLMGFTFTISQVMVIRELQVVFVGNELSIAIILANWLLLEATGSFVVGKKIGEWGLREGGYAFFQLLLSGLLPLTLYAIRAWNDLMGLAPGEGASLLQILFWTIPILAPVGIIDGILFALGCTLHSKWTEQGAVSIGRVYLLEAIGAGSGGALYTFLFIPYLGSFQVASLLGIANLLSGFLLVLKSRGVQKLNWAFLGLWGYLVFVNLLLFIPYSSQIIEKISMQRLWRGFEILESRWSPFGNVTVARREEQLTFFSNGIPLCNIPVPNIGFVEELVHYPLLLSPSPKNVLIVGGGFGGVIQEILKHPVEEVHYAEIDPLIIQLIRENQTPLTRKELENPKVRVHILDGRHFLKTTRQKFDTILLNLPGPSTLELNRFYTVEFFREAFRVLGMEGILALPVPGSETYLAPEARELNLSILKSLRETFSSVAVIPGDPNFILASPSEKLEPLTADRLIRRLEEDKIPTQFVTPGHIKRKMEKQRLEWLDEALKQAEGVRMNRDLNPSGIYYGIAYWNAQFHPSVQAFWNRVGEFRLSYFGLVLLALVGAVAVYRKRPTTSGGKGSLQGTLIWVVTTTGFFGTAMSILLILSFQTLYGYAYGWIGLLVAAFMAGLALGSWMMNRDLKRSQDWIMTLIGLESFIALFCLLVIFILYFLYSSGREPVNLWTDRIGFLLMNLLSGFWVGLEFPLSSMIFTGSEEGVGRTAGILYASDLLGAWAGALLVGVIFIPVLGILLTCGGIILLKLASLALLSISEFGFRHGE